MDSENDRAPIRVTEVEISDLHFSPDRNRHLAYVSMTIARDETTTQAQFHCSADQPETAPTARVTQDLVTDALRQAYRMPGFRRGERRIDVDIAKARIAPHEASGRQTPPSPKAVRSTPFD